MGKIATCSTIILSWSSSGITGPLEIDVVSATTGDVTTVTSSVDLGSSVTSYKWIVAVEPDTYYLEGNAQNYPSLVYSGNFTVSAGSDSSCLSNKQASSPSGVGGSAHSGSSAVGTNTATPLNGSTFSSGSDRSVAWGISLLGIGVLSACLL
jgi:hypothetical protein